MSAARLDMHQLQELVRLYRMGTVVRERATLLGMSTRTEQDYRKYLELEGLLDGPVDELPALEDLRAAVDMHKPPAAPREVKSTVDPWMDTIRAQVERGAQPRAIFDLLKRTHENFEGSESAVKRAVARIRKARGVDESDVVIRVETDPGEEAQVDFGFAGRFLDVETGRVRKAWVFVMLLAFSRHMFAKLVFDQRAETWVRLHEEAFAWFGGVPRVIVPDNLKAAVIRAAFGVGDRHELGLNRTYREVARFFEFKVDPTPVRSPNKKGKVESGVKYVCNNWLVTNGAEIIGDANGDLADWLIKTAGMRIHGTTGQRPLAVFEEVERDALQSLPHSPYDFVLWKQATVHKDSHVQFERALYSVPWPHVDQRVWIRADPSTVRIYAEDARIATHGRATSGRSTRAGHLPADRAALAERSIEYWIERGGKLDPSVGDYVQAVIDSDDALSKLRDVQGIVTMLERYPLRRAQKAVRRAEHFGAYTYQAIRQILNKALDLEEIPDDNLAHGELEQPRFARNPAELLAKQREGLQ